MKISELIFMLEGIKEEHGDLDCETYRFGRIKQQAPQSAYRKKLKGRERSECFWYEFDGEDRKGDKVCRL